ncbi:MAG: TetR/AcrR family transcriptional regulator [Methanoregula sp.]
MEPSNNKREAILETALVLFTKRGFYGTPTAMISREAGVATGTLFFYFRTKEDLIDELYRQIKSEAAAALQEGVDREQTTRAKIRRVGENAIAWSTTNQNKFRFMEQFAHSSFVSMTAHEEGISHFLFLKELIRDGIQEGVVRESETELLCAVLASSLSGLAARIMETPDPVRQKILVRQGLTFIWNGIAAYPDDKTCIVTNIQTMEKNRETANGRYTGGL